MPASVAFMVTRSSRPAIGGKSASTVGAISIATYLTNAGSPEDDMDDGEKLEMSSISSDTYARLSFIQRAQADAVAESLMHSVGGYHGSESDARTDAAAIVLAMRFAPMGDNHHAAAMCPYCTPSQR